MLIHVHVSATRLAARGDTLALDAIENVLRAHREAKHLASLDTDGLDSLEGHQQLSSGARGALRDIRGRRPVISGLRKEVPRYLELVDPNIETGTASERPEQRVIRADIRSFHDSAPLQRAVLLAENQTDAAFYCWLGRARISHHRWDHVDVAFQLRSGGGSQLEREFESASNDGFIVLAIADSDQKCKDGARGSTWNGLRRAATGKPPYQAARVLDVRMVENLIPTSLLRAALQDAGTQRQVERLSHLESSIGERFRAYADLKKGVTLFWIRKKLPPGSAEAVFWGGIERAVKDTEGNDAWNCPEPADCLDDAGREAKPCTCFVIPRLGKGTLESVISFLQKESPADAYAHVDFFRDSTLARLSDDILSWGCSRGWQLRA